MKSSNEVCLSLEVLEDRLALSGAFGGAIQAGVPVFPLTPYNYLTIPSANFASPLTGFRGSPAIFNNQNFNPATAFQNQMQSFQAAQTAMIDQLFSDLQSLFQQFNVHTLLVI